MGNIPSFLVVQDFATIHSSYWKRPIDGTGWWFGTSILFSHILGMSSSQLTSIFQRGSNHQPVYIVDFRFKNGDFPYSYVGLPEGNPYDPYGSASNKWGFAINWCDSWLRMIKDNGWIVKGWMVGWKKRNSLVMFKELFVFLILMLTAFPSLQRSVTLPSEWLPHAERRGAVPGGFKSGYFSG